MNISAPFRLLLLAGIALALTGCGNKPVEEWLAAALENRVLVAPYLNGGKQLMEVSDIEFIKVKSSARAYIVEAAYTGRLLFGSDEVEWFNRMPPIFRFKHRNLFSKVPRQYEMVVVRPGTDPIRLAKFNKGDTWTETIQAHIHRSPKGNLRIMQIKHLD